MNKVIAIAVVAVALCGLCLPAFAAQYQAPEVKDTNNQPINLMFEPSDFTGTFGNEVASNWTTFVHNDPTGYIKFFMDRKDLVDPFSYNNNHVTFPNNPNQAGPTSTVSQAIAVGRFGRYFDGREGAAGFYRQVSGVTPGKIYMYHGYIDFWPGAGIAYRPLFGINPNGGTNPYDSDLAQDWYPVAPNPSHPKANLGGAKWGVGSYAFDFDTGEDGSPEMYGGFHHIISAWPAGASTISLWHGVKIRTGGASGIHTGYLEAKGDTTPVMNTAGTATVAPVWAGDHFESDSMALHEFSLVDAAGQTGPTTWPVNRSWNGDFDIPATPDPQNPALGNTILVRNAYNNPGAGQYFEDWTIPAGWVPIGGGTGHAMWYKVNPNDAAEGTPNANSQTVTIGLRRGVGFFGLMQQVKVSLNAGSTNPAEYKISFTAKAKIFTKDSASKAGAVIGYDPLGGLDPMASSVIWGETTTDTNAWVDVATPQGVPTSDGQTITVFIMGRNVGFRKDNALRAGEDIGKRFGTVGEYSTVNFDNVRFSVTSCTGAPSPFTISLDSATQQETHRLKVNLSDNPINDSCISKQEVAVGSSAGGYNLVNWTQIDMLQNPTIYDINLPAGQVYVTVRRTSRSGQTTTSNSVPLTINASPNAYALKWNSEGEHVSVNAYNSDSPSIACGSDGVYLAYRDSDGKHGRGYVPAEGEDPTLATPPWWSVASWAGWDSKIMFRKRIGSIWTSPTLIATNPAPLGDEGEGSWDPYLVVDANGKLQCVYQDGGKYTNNTLNRIVSSNNGGSFGAADFFNVGADKWVSWHNKAVADGAGNIIISCDRTSTKTGENGYNILHEPAIVTVAPNGNYVFENIGQALVRTEDNGAPSPTVATDAAGNVYALWLEPGVDYTAKTLKFNKKAGSWGASASTIATGIPNQRSGNGDYSIAVEPNGSKIHVVYVTNHTIGSNPNSPGVWYVNSTDGGATWSAPMYLTNGAWPQLKLKGGKLHMVAYAQIPGTTNTYQPRHMYFVNGVPSLTVDIGVAGYTSQPSAKLARQDYNGEHLKMSHLAPGSFDIDANNEIHFAWSCNTSLASKDYYWVDYYTTAGGTSPNCDSIGCLLRWGVDGEIWGGGIVNKPAVMINKTVVAEGRIPFGDSNTWYVPYVYIAEEDGSAGMRVLVPQNVASANSGAENPVEPVIKIGDKVSLLADPNNAQMTSTIAVDLIDTTDNDMDTGAQGKRDNRVLYGEPQIGRLAGGQSFKGVTIVRDQAGPFPVTIRPPYIRGVWAGGVAAQGLPQVDGANGSGKFTGLPTNGSYTTIFGKVIDGGALPSGTFMYFYLDDGSGALGEYSTLPAYAPYNRIRGIKVYNDFERSLIWPSLDTYWSITGVISTERAKIDDPDGVARSGDEVYDQIRVFRPSQCTPEYMRQLFP